jgi:hypothetical protein
MKGRRIAKGLIVTGEDGKPRVINVLGDKSPTGKEIKTVDRPNVPNELSFRFTLDTDKFAKSFAQAAAEAIAAKYFRQKYGREPSPEELTEFHRKSLEQ